MKKEIFQYIEYIAQNPEININLYGEKLSLSNEFEAFTFSPLVSHNLFGRNHGINLVPEVCQVSFDFVGPDGLFLPSPQLIIVPSSELAPIFNLITKKHVEKSRKEFMPMEKRLLAQIQDFFDHSDKYDVKVERKEKMAAKIDYVIAIHCEDVELELTINSNNVNIGNLFGISEIFVNCNKEPNRTRQHSFIVLQEELLKCEALKPYFQNMDSQQQMINYIKTKSNAFNYLQLKEELPSPQIVKSKNKI